MKNVLVLFKKACERIDNQALSNIEQVFYDGKISFSKLVFLPTNDSLEFKSLLARSKENDDNLFILKRQDLAFDIKQAIAEILGASFCENQNAKEVLERQVKEQNGKVNFSEAIIPVSATYIPNRLGGIQGYVLDTEKLSLFCLPEKIDYLKPMVEEFVVKYFEDKYDIKREIFTVKYFGDSSKLEFAIKEIKDKYKFVDYSLKEKDGDYLVSLIFNGNVIKREYDEVVRLFVSRLKDEIYAEFDESLERRLFDLLRLRNVKIATAESFTAGRVVSAIIKNAGASKYVVEGIVSYSNQSKMNRLEVSSEDLNSVGAVSSKVAYQMSLSLLANGDCDLAISTTGYADSGADEFGNQVGLYFIGIGMKDGVDVYKFRGEGTREEITERAKNTALFLAIKKLKNI